MSMSKGTKKGFYTVEAAIFLPIFIIAILTLGYMIKVIGAGESVMYIMCDEGGKQAQDAYLLKVEPTFPYRVEKRVVEEAEDVTKADVNGYRYLYSFEGYTDLIKFHIQYHMSIRLPLGFYDDFSREQGLILRGFTGVNFKENPIPPEELQQEKEIETVWVFPRAGEKYHKEDCTYIKVYAQIRTLGKSLRNTFAPCKLCDPYELTDGNLVYCFPNSGRVYHRGNCVSVDRYVVDMDKEEAIDKGYNACFKCGG